MAKGWWSKKKKIDQVDALRDIGAMIEFLQEVKYTTQQMLPELRRLKELEKEYSMAKTELLHVNLEAQSNIFDKLVQQYEFFQNDVDINGIRMKQIAQNWLQRTKELGMVDKHKVQKKKWSFNW